MRLPAAATACVLIAFGGCKCSDDVVEFQTPELRLSPEVLDFGELPVGAAVTRKVTLINGGNGVYRPDTVPFVEGDAFTLVTACQMPLAPDSLCDMEIRFTPRAEGPLAGGVVVVDVDNELLEVPLTGTGTPAQVVVAPEQIDFGGVSVGELVAASFTVENRGGVPLTLPSIVSGDGFFVTGPRCTNPLELAVDETVLCDVAFSPARGGAHAGSAVVELCGALCGPTVFFAGDGLAPRIDVQPREVDFGAVGVGTGPVDVALTVSNVGLGDLVVSRLDLLSSVDDAELALVLAGALPLVIPDGAASVVTVRYDPDEAHGGLASTLRIRSNDPISPDVIIPIDGSSEGCALRFVPSVGQLGVLDEGQSRDLDVVLRSTGTVPCDIESFALTGAGFSFVDGAPPAISLPPLESLLFAIRGTADAAAVAAGFANGTLRVRAAGLDDIVMPVGFFSGTAGCQPRAPAPNVALGSVVLGQGTSGTVVIQNVGTAPCVLTDADEAPGLPFDDGFDFSAARAELINTGLSGSVELAFSAIDEGQRSAFVALRFAEQGGVDCTAPPSGGGAACPPLLVSATARGVTGTLVGEPPVLEFGPLIDGCPGESSVATFVNRGGVDVNVTGFAMDPPNAPFNVSGPSTLPLLMGPGSAFIVDVSTQARPPGVYEAELQAFVDEGILEATVRARLIIEPSGVPITETFEAADVSQVDILFVVDNSGSMADDQQILADNFASFVDFAEPGLSFHLGVTTTDVLGGTGGPLVDGYLTQSGGIESAFAQQALVGVEGFGVELGLEAMRRAVDDFANSGNNAGFLRDNAALSIVIVSDEEDNGGDPAVAALDPSVVRPVETYIGVLEALKGGSIGNAPVLVSVVVTPGFGQRYEQVANAFGGVVLDISSPDWGTQLSQIGQATFGLQRAFRLANDPDPATVVVVVDGVATTEFSVNGNTVTLTNEPPAGAVVDVTYEALCQ